jgi:ankyrin repeat protein
VLLLPAADAAVARFTPLYPHNSRPEFLLLLQDGDTPLINAADYGHLEVVKKLLGAGADVNAVNKVRVRDCWNASRGW